MGIPVVGSDIGGLPESIGDGGVVISPKAAPEVWADTVKRLWRDEIWFQEKSTRARAHAARPAIAIDRQVDSFVEVLTRAASSERTRFKAVAGAS